MVVGLGIQAADGGGVARLGGSGFLLLDGQCIPGMVVYIQKIGPVVVEHSQHVWRRKFDGDVLIVISLVH